MIELSYLDSMTGGDRDMKTTMLDMILAEIPTEIANMNTAYSNQNWRSLFDVSHKMKTTLSFVGNEAMTKANYEIEKATRLESDLETVAPNLNILNQHLTPVLEHLKIARVQS
jgi:HPt (histidine-containing phosphotransfer) domain-containing protein